MFYVKKASRFRPLLLLLISAFALSISGSPLYAAPPQEGEEILAEVHLNKSKLSDVMILFELNGEIYAPVRELKNLLEFPPEPGEETYLPLPQAEAALGAKLNFNFAAQTLGLTSTEKKFPIEERFDREERHRRFAARSTAQKINGAQVIKGSAPFQLPFVDISAGYFYNASPGRPSNTNYGLSAHAFGITGAWDSEIIYQGMDYYNSPALNLRTSRYFDDKPFLGFVRKVSFGDISASGSAAGAGMSTGAGAAVSSYAEGVHIDKTYNIREAIPLGWEVELYRNGEFLGVQRAGADGYFEFADIILYQGENRFEMLFYGPQGQTRKEERRLFYRGNILDKGEFGFRAYAVEKNQNITNTGINYRDEFKGPSALAELSYGLTENMTATAQLIAEPVTKYSPAGYTKQNKIFGAAGMSFMLSQLYVEVQGLFDKEEQAAALNVTAQTSLYGLRINAENEYFGKTITSKNILFNSLVENATRININQSILGLPLNGSYTRLTDSNSNTQNELLLTIYKTLPGATYAGAGLRYMDSFYGFKHEYLNIYLSKFFGRHTLRADANYNIDLDKISSISASSTFRLLNNLDGSLRYDRSISDYQNSRYYDRVSAGVNLRTSWGYFNIDAGFGEDDARYVTAGYSLSLGYDARNKKLLHSPDKIYDSGVIAARAYADLNQNNVFDNGDEVIHEAPFSIEPRSGSRELVESKNSYSYFPFLNKYRPYRVKVEVDDIEDSFSLMDAQKPLYARVRPGEIVYVDYPLRQSAYVEGRVNLTSANGVKKPLGGLRLTLVNTLTNEKSEPLLSDFDGYFSFEKAPLGYYIIEPDFEQLSALGYTFSSCGELALETPEEYFVCDLQVSEK